MPKEKILLVDDSQDIIDGMKLFLELKNYEVLSLLNVTDLDQTIREHKPALLILDIFISGRDGRTICQRLKNSAYTQHIKIILSSAAPNALSDFKNYGADDILEKPFGLDEIYSKVERSLKVIPPL